MEWQRNINSCGSADQDLPLDLTVNKKSNGGVASEGPHNTASGTLGNQCCKGRIPVSCCVMYNEPLDLSMKCCPVGENKGNTTVTGGDTILGISSVPHQENKDKNVSENVGNQLRNIHYRAPPSGQIMALPSGQIMAPPSGQIMAPPSGQIMAPPSGQIMAPPSGQIMALSRGQIMAPASGQIMVPPSGQIMVPPSGQIMVPPSGQIMAPPSGQIMAPPSGQIMAPPSGQIVAIPTNPDSAENDLDMISTRLEQVVMNHYGYILNFDKTRAITKEALATYKAMESKFSEMIYQPVQGKDYSDVVKFCQFTWKNGFLMIRDFFERTPALVRDFPHFNKFESIDQQHLIRHVAMGSAWDLLNNTLLVDFENDLRIWISKDSKDVYLFGRGFLPSFYPKQQNESVAETTFKKLHDLKLPILQLILLYSMNVYSKEFTVTGGGYLMASKIEYLLSEALRHSIAKHQKDETLLPRVMTIMEKDFLEYLKLHTVDNNTEVQDKLRQLFADVSSDTMTPEQCRKWVMRDDENHNQHGK